MASGGEVEGKLDDNVGSEDLEQLKCQPCQEDGDLRKAVGLCIDCQEYLCQRCFDGHRLPKPMRTHQLVDKQQMMQSQIQLARKDRCTERCPQHDDEVVKYYCTIHCQLSCSVCLNLNHRTCKGVQYIPDVANDLANNEEFQQVEIQLASILAKSKKAKEIATQNSETFEKSYNKALKMVKDFRQELNDIIDMVENKIIKQAAALKSKEMEQIGLVTEKCRQAVEELQATLAKIEAFRKSKQNCNLFTEMMKVKSQLNSLDDHMMEAEREQSITKCEIQFAPNTEILNTLKQTEVFGLLSVMGPQQTKKVKESENVSMPDTRTVVKAEYAQDINVKSGDEIKPCCITGSVILPDNRLVICDRNNHNIKAVDVKQGRVLTQLKLSSCPWDIAKISSNQVAITLPDEKIVVFVTAAANMTVDRALPVEGRCYGVDYRDGKLAVSFMFPYQVKVLNLQGTVLYSISKQDQTLFSCPFYLTFNHDSSALYVSNYGRDSVECVKLDGTVVASYTDSKLKGPHKVVVDNSGKVYVCAVGSNTIHQLSQDCKKIRVLLTKADGLDEPHCVSYDNTENRLCVGGRGNNVKVYKAVLGKH